MTRYLKGLLLATFTPILLALSLGTAWGQDALQGNPYLKGRVNWALEFTRTGTETQWRDPKTGEKGTITVVRQVSTDAKTPCREYIRTLDVEGGEPIVTKGTGCRQKKQDWLLTEFTDPPKAETRESGKPGAPETKTATAPATAPVDAAPKAAPGAASPSRLPATPPSSSDGKTGGKVEARPSTGAGKAAATEPKKKPAPKAAAAKEKPAPKIPSKIPTRTEEWEATSDDG